MKRICILVFLLLPAATLFAGYRQESHYVPMRDGVALAADVALPSQQGSERLPAVVTLTRYWRGVEGRGPLASFDERAAHKELLTSKVYAVVVVDVRGTGASFGTWAHPWSAKEIADGFDVVDWIVKQPWSNGVAGAMGDSYEGSSALFLAAANHPAVKAVVPRFIEYDLYDEIAFPGGVFNDGFVRRWSEENALLDRGLTCDDRTFECFLVRLLLRGPKPVGGDRVRLRQAILEHRANGDLHAGARTLTSRDEVSGLLGTSIDGFSLHAFREAIERSGVAIFSWGGWMDGATPDGVIRRLALRNEQKAIIGPWSHSATEDANPYLPAGTPVSPSEEEQGEIIVEFFDHYLKGIDNGFDGLPPLVYFTMGEDEWKATDVWPPPGVVTRTMYLGPGGVLTDTRPASAVARFTVDFTATTGLQNRWMTQLSGDVVYPDRAAEDRKLLTFTTAELDEDVEITGNVASCQSSTECNRKARSCAGSFCSFSSSLPLRQRRTRSRCPMQWPARWRDRWPARSCCVWTTRMDRRCRTVASSPRTFPRAWRLSSFAPRQRFVWTANCWRRRVTSTWRR